VIESIYKTRVQRRGKGDEIWGWAMAYKRGDALAAGVKS
jgi:hypothetical protein